MVSVVCLGMSWSGRMVDGKKDGYGTEILGGDTWTGLMRAGRQEGRWVTVYSSGDVTDYVYENDCWPSSVVRRVSHTKQRSITK